MRAEDVFRFIEHHLEQMGEEERKKLIEHIQVIDTKLKPKRMTKDQEQRAEFRKRLQKLI